MLSDRVVVKITSKPGETFVDRMIALVEGSVRQKTPNEIALNILLATLTIVFLLAVITLSPMAVYSGSPQILVVLVTLLVALIPTTIGALVSAIGVAGMDRLVQRNVLAMSGRAVEAAGDVSTLLLDKTGTITFGNRQATGLMPVARGIARTGRRGPAGQPGRRHPGGPSIVVLVKDRTAAERHQAAVQDGEVVEFSARTRMSGIDLPCGRRSARAMAASRSGSPTTAAPRRPDSAGVDEIWRRRHPAGGRVGERDRPGVAHYLKDIVKQGIAERFADLRAMGIRTVMITGDNPLTAKAIADEAGVDDFLAEATPEDKLA